MSREKYSDTWAADHGLMAPSLIDFEGSGTLDQQMEQLSKVKRVAVDAGWMRYGWPERVGGRDGSPLLRGYLGEALTARDLVEFCGVGGLFLVLLAFLA